jgi:predicted aspartyl protease
MPLLDATFRDQAGLTDRNALLQFGPSIQVIVGHFTQPGSIVATSTDTETTYALVDTGACESCIDSALAKKLGLPVIDTMQIAGANGSHTHDVYLAYINILGLEFSQFGRFAGVHLSAGQQAHGVLLGRTFLSNVMLIYDGLRGQITLTAARVG